VTDQDTAWRDGRVVLRCCTFCKGQGDLKMLLLLLLCAAAAALQVVVKALSDCGVRDTIVYPGAKCIELLKVSHSYPCSDSVTCDRTASGSSRRSLNRHAAGPGRIPMLAQQHSLWHPHEQAHPLGTTSRDGRPCSCVHAFLQDNPTCCCSTAAARRTVL
jgi:hypothetical protein